MRTITVVYDETGRLTSETDSGLHFEQEDSALRVTATLPAGSGSVRAYISAPNGNTEVTDTLTAEADGTYSYTVPETYMAKGTLRVGFERYGDGFAERYQPLKILIDRFVSVDGTSGDNVYVVTVAVGEVETLPAGSQATVTNSGTKKDMVLDFGIPKGDKGEQGDKGDKGDKGDTGNAATVAVGTVTTLDAGSNAAVINSGTAQAVVLNFGIPKGDKGDKGEKGDTGDLADGTTVIATQSDWDSMVASTTWNGAVHVVINCDLMHNGTIDVPPAVQSIDGRGHTISGTGSMYSARNVYNLNILADSGFGFMECSGLINCSTHIFFECTNLVNCTTESDIGYWRCDRLTNCTGNLYASNTHVDFNTCDYNPIATTSAASVTLLNGMEYRTDSTVFSIAFPSVLDSGYTATLVFTSGGTPTSLSYSSSIYWSGDDLDSYGSFVPVANRRYTVRFWYDGALLRADVCGVNYKYFDTEGALPLTVTNGVQCTLADWRLSGGFVQGGTPAYNAPVPMEFTGDYDETTGKYLIPVAVNGETAVTVALDVPLRKIKDYADYIDFKNQKVVRYIQHVVFTGSNYTTWNDYGTSWTMQLFVPVGLIDSSYNGTTKFICCTHAATTNYDESPILFSNTNSNTFQFRKAKWGFENTATADDLNTYLAAQYAAGTPVEVAYVLQTPYEESIEIAGLQCMRGETVYSSSTTVAPSKLYVKYETNL